MQVRAAHPAKIRIIRGGKKKTHSSAFVKFETFVFKKLRDACAPCYLDFYWGLPQPILTPNSFYITTCFFNTNLTNLSNCAGLTSNKETIRFVFL